MYSCSAIYHVFWPISETTALTCAKVDYMGIVFMIWGSYYPFIRFLFYDDANTYVTYGCCLVDVAFACGCALFPTYMQQPKYRWIRQVVFWGLGSVIPIAITQGMLKYGASGREMKLFGYPQKTQHLKTKMLICTSNQNILPIVCRLRIHESVV